MPKVSVIVPVYNAEQCLGWCINSILNQTFRDLELLLVNDGSTDGSLRICENYAALDGRVRVIDQENGGVSSARNHGLAQAKGEYIQFADSDDTVAPNMTERLLQAAEQYQKETVVCSFYQVLMQQNGILPQSLQKLGLAQGDAERAYGYDALWNNLIPITWETTLMECCWNKLYSRQIIREHGIRFLEDISLGEDFLFNLEYLRHCSGAVFLSDPLYFYIIGQEGSLTGKGRLDILDVLCRMDGQFKGDVESHHPLSESEKGIWSSQFASRLSRGFLNLCTYYPEAAAKKQIAECLQRPLVQQAFAGASYVFPEFQEFPALVKQYDVGGIWAACRSKCSLPAQPPAAPAPRPGGANRALVKFCRLLQKIPQKGIQKWAHIVELNLMTVGIKTTAGRALHKIKKVVTKRP